MPNATDVLAGLRDIHLPEAVSGWPPAAGWWLSLALLCACAAGLAIWLRRRRASARRAAQRELDRLARSFRADADAARLAAGLSALLRRLALVQWARRDVASLHGDARAEFLASSRRRGFPAALAISLERAVYGGPARGVPDGAAAAQAEGEAWIAAARRWIGGRP